MRLRANGCAVVLTAVLFGVACDTRPRTDTSSAEHGPDATGPAAQGQQSSDALITTTIQGKYFASNDVKGRRIDVDSQNGVVTLKGTVENDRQREQAVQIARSVQGVKDVNAQLTIESGGAADTAQRRDSYDSGSPAWITLKVQSQYFLNPELKPWNIDVDTSRDGVVTLTGRVDSADDKAEAVRIAQNTAGVKSVNDQLRVEPQTAATTGTMDKAGRRIDETADRAKEKAGETADRVGEKADRAGERVGEAADRAGDAAARAGDRAGGAVEDAWVTTKIQSKFFVDDDVRARNIDVDTNDGIVTLKGSVGSENERVRALAIARNTDGVREVRDTLVVDRNTGDMSRSTSPRGTAGQKVDDAWITMKIQSSFFLHDEIKARNVDVDTKNGVVTLKGTVPSDAAKYAAEQLAKETDGVTRVNNTLRVEAKTATSR